MSADTQESPWRICVRCLLNWGLVIRAPLLQSGNAVLASIAKDTAALERKLEEATERVNVRPDYMLRSWRELPDAISKNPFPKEAQRDPSHLVLLFPKMPVSRAAGEALIGAIKGRERAAGDGRTITSTIRMESAHRGSRL